MAAVQESDLARLHNDAIKNDPFISKALGPNPKCALPAPQPDKESDAAASPPCGDVDAARAAFGHLGVACEPPGVV